jgi:hypothetical protein
MNSKWEEFIDNIKDTTGKLAKDELKNLVKDAKSDSEDFIKRQGEKLELYLNQLASGQITKEQCEGYLIDLRDLAEMQALKMSVAAKARAQSLAMGVTNIVLNGLIKLI